MTHSLVSSPATAATLISTRRKSKDPFLGFQRKVVCAYQGKSNDVVLKHKLLDRRTIMLGLGGAMLGLKIGERSAEAARRPPPPPPQDKKDPSLTALQAKVLASKKRKEALKQAMEKQREKGKQINQPPPPAPPTNEPPPPSNE